MKLYYDVTDQLITQSEQQRLVSGYIDELEVEFTFSEEWDGLTKTALFRYDDSTVYPAVLVDDMITKDMSINLPSGNYKLTIMGSGVDGNRYTANYITLPVELWQGDGENPLPDLEQQYLEQLQVLIDNKCGSILINGVSYTAVDGVIALLASALATPSALVERDANGGAAFDTISLSTNPNDTTYDIGQVYFDEDEIALNVKMTSEITQDVGKEFFSTYVVNNTGDILTGGKVGHYDGTLGASGKVKIDLFIADGTDNPALISGLSTETAPVNGTTLLTQKGFVRDLNTSAYSQDDILYASPTVPGGITNVRPQSPNYVVPVGIVIYSHSSQGIIYVIPPRTMFADETIIHNEDGYYTGNNVEVALKEAYELIEALSARVATLEGV